MTEPTVTNLLEIIDQYRREVQALQVKVRELESRVAQLASRLAITTVEEFVNEEAADEKSEQALSRFIKVKKEDANQN